MKNLKQKVASALAGLGMSLVSALNFSQATEARFPFNDVTKCYPLEVYAGFQRGIVEGTARTPRYDIEGLAIIRDLDGDKEIDEVVFPYLDTPNGPLKIIKRAPGRKSPSYKPMNLPPHYGFDLDMYGLDNLGKVVIMNIFQDEFDHTGMKGCIN